MKEFDRFFKNLVQSLQAFSRLVATMGRNLERDLESPKKTKPAKSAKPVTPAIPAKSAKPARVARIAPGRVAKKPAEPQKPTVTRRKKPTDSEPPEPQKPTVILRKKPTDSESASVLDTIRKVWEKNPEGIDAKTLEEKTGLGEKQIQNTVSWLKKQGKIDTSGQGMYVPAGLPEPV
jgi:hypothetical protein